MITRRSCWAGLRSARSSGMHNNNTTTINTTTTATAITTTTTNNNYDNSVRNIRIINNT